MTGERSHIIDAQLSRKEYLLICRCGWSARRRLTRSTGANSEWLISTTVEHAREPTPKSGGAT